MNLRPLQHLTSTRGPTSLDLLCSGNEVLLEWPREAAAFLENVLQTVQDAVLVLLLLSILTFLLLLILLLLLVFMVISFTIFVALVIQTTSTIMFIGIVTRLY